MGACLQWLNRHQPHYSQTQIEIASGPCHTALKMLMSYLSLEPPHTLIGQPRALINIALVDISDDELLAILARRLGDMIKHAEGFSELSEVLMEERGTAEQSAVDVLCGETGSRPCKGLALW